jgi:hypothetical protein
MTQVVQLRGDTAANLASTNRVFAVREVIIETDTLKMKVGNGGTAYNSLSYVVGGGGGGGSSTYAGLTDAATANLPSLNGPLNTALTLKAALASPALTGTPTAPTAAAATNTTQLATTAHVFAERANAATLISKTMSGSSNTFTNLPATGISGVIPIANLGVGTPTGFKFLRDDNTLQTIAGGGDALVANPLSQFAATTSAQLKGIISDETGTGGALVFAADPALTGVPTAPTAAAGTNTTQLATTAHVFGERSNVATLANKTLTTPVCNTPTLNTPVFSGTSSGTATLPSTVTMAASPSQADNSLKIATTAYVDTLGATKVTANAAVSLTGANTLTQASHSNRSLNWTGSSTAAQALPTTQSAGDFVEMSNNGSVPITFTNGTAAAGFKMSALPGETFQAKTDGSSWKSLTPRVNNAIQVLTPGTTVATDVDIGTMSSLTPAQNFTLSNPTNPADGGVYGWWITQDATGSRVLTLGSKFKKPAADSVTLSTGANKVDFLSATYNATKDIYLTKLVLDIG